MASVGTTAMIDVSLGKSRLLNPPAPRGTSIGSLCMVELASLPEEHRYSTVWLLEEVKGFGTLRYESRLPR